MLLKRIVCFFKGHRSENQRDKEHPLISKAMDVLDERIRGRGGIVVRTIIFNPEGRDGVTVRVKGLICEEEFIHSSKLVL